MQKWGNPDGTVLISNMSENPTLWHTGRLKSSRTTKQFSFYFIIIKKYTKLFRELRNTFPVLSIKPRLLPLGNTNLKNLHSYFRISLSLYLATTFKSVSSFLDFLKLVNTHVHFVQTMSQCWRDLIKCRRAAWV